jgi:predicted AAA+ superfamily ATPase
MKNTKLIQRILKQFAESVSDISKESYREVLEEVISDLESRLECVMEELNRIPPEIEQ